MPLPKDLLAKLEVDYLNDVDTDGVEIPADLIKKFYKENPSEKLSAEQLNELLALGVMKKDEVDQMDEWAQEAALSQAQEYGRKGREKANAGFDAFWEPIQHEASMIWRRNPSLSKRQVAERIEQDMKNLPPEDRRSARTIRGKIKKPNQI